MVPFHLSKHIWTVFQPTSYLRGKKDYVLKKVRKEELTDCENQIKNHN